MDLVTDGDGLIGTRIAASLKQRVAAALSGSADAGAELAAGRAFSPARGGQERVDMDTALLHGDGQRTWALVFARGDEVVGTLTEFAAREQIAAAHFTAIGAFSRVTLGYFDRDRRDYRKIVVAEQVEVLSLVGDVALQDREPKIHAHVVIGKSDGSAHGGHLLEAHVWPTLELMLTESPRALARRSDPTTGLALIDVTRRAA